MFSPNPETTQSPLPGVSVADEKSGSIPRIAPNAVEAEPARVLIRVSEDKLRAFVAIQPPVGLANGDLNAEFILRRIRESGIDTEHIDHDVLGYFVNEWNKNHTPIAERLVTESQYLPLRGENAKIEYLVDPNLQFKPPDMGGSIDFRSLNLIKPVKKGQPIARKRNATPGAPGINLFGQPSPAEVGKDTDLPQGRNTQISESDPLLLEAAVTGFLQQKDGLLTVNECFVVEGSVDYSTGNISYDQSAMIKGDVADGFTLNVGGALEIVGAVGEAKLIVGGDVLIKKGFVGAGHGLITAKGNVNLGFSSNQVIRAHGDILLEKESFNCQVYSRKSITVYGSLVGGLAMAFTEIECRVAGNDLGTKTEIEVGTDYILTENKKLLDDKIKELTGYLAKINLKLKTFREVYRTRKRFTSSEAKMMLELRDMQDKIQASLPELERRKKDLVEQIRLGFLREGIRIRVEKKVHPGVVLKVGGECMRIQEEVPGPRIFLFAAGRIKVI